MTTQQRKALLNVAAEMRRTTPLDGASHQKTLNGWAQRLEALVRQDRSDGDAVKRTPSKAKKSFSQSSFEGVLE